MSCLLCSRTKSCKVWLVNVNTSQLQDANEPHPPTVPKASAPWLQSQCLHENFVDSKLSHFSHHENQDPPAECPSWWHAPPAREECDCHNEAACVLPRLYPQVSPSPAMSRAQPMPRPCAHHALGAGSQPVSPGSSSCREAQPPQKNAAWACGSPGGLCALKNVWGKLLTSPRCNMNTSLQGKWLFWDKQPPTPNFVLSRPSPGPPIQAQACPGNKAQRDCPRELKLVAGDIGQHASPRVWNDFRMEPLKVKLFHQTLQTSALAATSQPTPASLPGLLSQEQWPLLHSLSVQIYVLTPSWVGGPWPGFGDRDKGPCLPVLTRRNSAALLADGGPSDLGSENTLRARPGSPLHAWACAPHCEESGEGSAPRQWRALLPGAAS